MIKKVLSTMLVATLIVGCSCIPTKAANSTSEDGTLQSTVTSQIASSWLATVPGDISLEGKSGSYRASLGGDVASATSISIVPDSQFTLTNGTIQVTAYVTQEKQQWIGSEITQEGISTIGTIVVNDNMPAGEYVGSLNFHVNCTEDLGDLIAKIEMMQNIDLYALGDSIIDGQVGSDKPFYGTAEAIDNLYGTNSFKNYAVAGAFFTQELPYLPNIVQQATALNVRLKGSNRYTDNSVIIFDGGGNDILHIEGEGDSSLIDTGDIMDAFYGTMYHLSTTMVDDQGQSHNNPIIFIIPNTPEFNGYWDSFKSAIERAQENFDTLLIIDCREFITESDLCSDKIHMNVTGQTKLAHKIVDVLYDWYN